MISWNIGLQNVILKNGLKTFKIVLHVVAVRYNLIVQFILSDHVATARNLGHVEYMYILHSHDSCSFFTKSSKWCSRKYLSQSFDIK